MIIEILERTIAAPESTLPKKVKIKPTYKNLWSRLLPYLIKHLHLNKNLKYFLEILERTIAAPELELPIKVQIKHLKNFEVDYGCSE